MEFLICGVTTATLLRSMQQFMISMSNQQGGLGWAGETAQFLKLKILESFSIDANGNSNKMYLLTKAPENQLEKTIIADLVYQPLYITNEITNSLQKNYVRSRTLVHLCRTDGIACIEVQGTNGILGM